MKYELVFIQNRFERDQDKQVFLVDKNIDTNSLNIGDKVKVFWGSRIVTMIFGGVQYFAPKYIYRMYKVEGESYGE